MRSLRVLVCCLLAPALAGFASAGDPPLKIAMPRTLFHDSSDLLVKSFTEPFAELMKETSGLTGDLQRGGTATEAADKLAKGEVQLAVLHGFEFAWASQKHPELRPVMIAVNAAHEPRAHLLVNGDHPAKSFADLKGAELAVPKRTSETVRHWAELMAREAGAEGTEPFFKQVVRPDNVEGALDDLRRGKFAAALVDAPGLAFYKDLKPGVFTRLRVLGSSEVFPPIVIAYKQGGLSDATLEKVREALRSATTSAKGRDMLKTWKLTAFEPVPPNFEQRLALSRKTFPPLDAKK